MAPPTPRTAAGAAHPRESQGNEVLGNGVDDNLDDDYYEDIPCNYFTSMSYIQPID
jgi:hypothetical protein